VGGWVVERKRTFGRSHGRAQLKERERRTLQRKKKTKKKMMMNKKEEEEEEEEERIRVLWLCPPVKGLFTPSFP
jgi:hypothetical protein